MEVTRGNSDGVSDAQCRCWIQSLWSSRIQSNEKDRKDCESAAPAARAIHPVDDVSIMSAKTLALLFLRLPPVDLLGKIVIGGAKPRITCLCGDGGNTVKLLLSLSLSFRLERNTYISTMAIISELWTV